MFEAELQAKAVQAHALYAEIAAAAAELSGPAAVTALSEVLAGVRQGELATIRLIERADRSGEYATDGAASTAAYVRIVANENPGWASKRVHAGRALADRLPAAAAGFARGELGLDHVTVIDQATKKLTDPALVAGIDDYLALLAPTMTPKQLAAAAADIRSQAAPEETDAETAAKRAAQRLHLSQTSDGMWRLDGWLDPEAGLIVSTAIADFLRKPDPAGDIATETIARRRADALVDLCRQAVTHQHDCHSLGVNRPTIIIGLDHQQLLDGLGTAGVVGTGDLPAGTVRRMACDAHIIPVIYGTDSEELDFGRRTRTVTAGLWRKLAARDGGCTFPQCDRPAAWCQAHHRQEWYRQHGPTSDHNLDLLCTHHHVFVHEKHWTITIANDKHRTPIFHPPDGRPPTKGQRHTLIRRHRRT